MKRVDLMGNRYGDLVVIGTEQKDGRRVWVCRCVCGNEISVTTGNLKNGSYSNCGCKRSENRRVANLKHGHRRPFSREYSSWKGIIYRCCNPKNAQWKHYGGRGITVCDRWRNSFEAFLADMGASPGPGFSIDRIDNDRGYEPQNCRWASMSQQARNTRRAVRLDGRPLKDVAEERGLKWKTVEQRVRRGATPEQALSPLSGSAYRAMLSAAPSPGGDHEA